MIEITNHILTWQNKSYSNQRLNSALSGALIIFSNSFQSSFDLVIDCLDNFEARSATTWACMNVPCVHLGFGKDFTWSILWNEEYQTPETAVEWDICELPGASSFVHMVSAIGSLVVQEYLTTGKKKEFCGNRFSIREVI